MQHLRSTILRERKRLKAGCGPLFIIYRIYRVSYPRRIATPVLLYRNNHSSFFKLRDIHIHRGGGQRIPFQSQHIPLGKPTVCH